MDPLLQQWRDDTPGCTNQIHLNNASAGLMPLPVLDAIVGHVNREAKFGGYESADDAAAAVNEAYDNVSKLLGGQPRNVAIVENSTVAFFQALSAFDFKPGDVIVTTRNDYISNQLAYLSLARRHGVDVRRATDLATGGADLQSVQDLLREKRVRLLAVTWVPTNSGLIQPVEALGQIAEASGVPYLVDACQAIGQIPIDVSKLKCDFLSATARKFLRGPRGIGFLYVSDRALKRGDFPLYIDMRGAEWVSADNFQPAPDARRFENWEFPYSLVLGLGEAARYALAVGIERGGVARQTKNSARYTRPGPRQSTCRHRHHRGRRLGRYRSLQPAAQARHQHLRLPPRLRGDRHGRETRRLSPPARPALLQYGRRARPRGRSASVRYGSRRCCFLMSGFGE